MNARHRAALVAIAVAAAIGFVLTTAGVVELPDLEAALTDLSDTLGTWTFPAGWNTVQLSRWTTPGYVVVAEDGAASMDAYYAPVVHGRMQGAMANEVDHFVAWGELVFLRGERKRVHERSLRRLRRSAVHHRHDAAADSLDVQVAEVAEQH
jgi:hypothetical protein